MPEHSPLEDAVVELEKISSFELPITDVIETAGSGFKVIGNRIFAPNHFGPLNVYDLASGKPVGVVPFARDELQGFATDGEFLYVLQKGNLHIDPYDLLGVTWDKHMDWLTFSGKAVHELKWDLGDGMRDEKSTTKGHHVETCIIPIPLANFSGSSIIYAPGITTDIPKVLNQSSKGSLLLHSAHGSVALAYGTFGHNWVTHIRHGTPLSDVDGNQQEVNRANEARARRKIHPDVRIYASDSRIFAGIEHYLHEEPTLKSSLPVIFADKCEPSPESIACLVHEDDKVYTMSKHKHRNNMKGALDLHEPNVFTTYHVRIRQLTPAK